MTVDTDLTAAGEAEARGDLGVAAKHYVDVIRQAAGSSLAQTALNRIAKTLFANAIATRDHANFDGAIKFLVRSIGLNPASGEVRAELERLLATRPQRDTTKECLIFPDVDRATRFYSEAIRTTIEFRVYGGITGDIYEFGVLAGWTARLFAERMRDTQFHGDLHLFDSFKGLPRQKGAIDTASYDVTRGIWQDEMEKAISSASACRLTSISRQCCHASSVPTAFCAAFIRHDFASVPESLRPKSEVSGRGR